MGFQQSYFRLIFDTVCFVCVAPTILSAATSDPVDNAMANSPGESSGGVDLLDIQLPRRPHLHDF
jgi:hypothetical protein